MAIARVAAALLEPDFRLPAAGVPDDAGPGPRLLGRSPEMANLRASIERAAGAPYPVLIERGDRYGKGAGGASAAPARAARQAAFCAVNCAALTDELFEAELFGHSRGAFTGAVAERTGLFEAADRGTLFLGRSRRAVGARPGEAVAGGAGGRDPAGRGEYGPAGRRATAGGDQSRPWRRKRRPDGFRQDLLFRLAVVCLSIPPLRDRAATSSCWSATSGRSNSAAPASGQPCRPRRWPRWRVITGPATSASCRT